ncbi:MAG: pitrilysin family protein [Kiritimatiellae bacterium]|nr:pitrilysin family protein [Kiritimatiellia bacterium]MDD5520885.1 pitrilysin family protein [Kiritimatiellia bacterium]
MLTANAVESRQTSVIDIPYTKYVLDNGLILIVHEDHKAPIVAVNVWYHVGSKNEKAGKTGFAHLFEHLMFNGSEHFDDDYFKAAEKVGATDLNGTTSEDRTNYFENAPKDALDYLLWLESDRMGHLLGVISQAKLDEQRGVVQNEKRQGDNQPYAIAYELITKNTRPAGHPYSWQVIGSMEDLNAASLDDVKEWFKTYYGAANATIVVAGDVTPQEVLEKVKKNFDSIPSGPPLARHKGWIAKNTGILRQVAQDRVPQARIYKVWNVPQYGVTDVNYLDLVSDVLTSGKNSRLYKRLVYDDQIATDVSAFMDAGEIAGQFYIIATAKPGGALAKVEKAIDEELAKFLKSGPTQRELQRIKTQYEAGFIRGIERIGGFGGKSDILAHNSVFTGNPDYYKVSLKEVREATARDLLDAAKKWLSDGQYILEIHPFPKHTNTTNDVDRSKLPVPELKPEVRFPTLQRTTLSNGMKVVFAEHHAIPLVQFNLLVDAGYAADQFAIPGAAKLAMEMLTEGTKKRNSLEISDELALLGAQLRTGCDLDTSFISLNTLKSKMDEALDIFADITMNPTFPEGDFKRLQKQFLAGIQREKTEPNMMALRVLPKLIYGTGHAYGNPFTGSGTEASMGQLTPADMKKFHSTWFRPDNATLVIIGDTALNEIVPKMEKLFKRWKSGSIPAKNIATVAQRHKPSVYIIDRPGSQQSVIFVGDVILPKSNPDEIAIELMNKILGGDFTSRINMNLREGKHWTYGARSAIPDARGQRPFMAVAPVQGDKTKDAMLELNKEFRTILAEKPVTDAEFGRVVTNQTLRLPGTWETMGRIAGAMSEIVRFGLPDDYFQTYARKIQAITREDISNAAAKIVHPESMVWVVVGDRAKIEKAVRELNFGEVQFLDADGKLLEK